MMKNSLPNFDQDIEGAIDRLLGEAVNIPEDTQVEEEQVAEPMPFPQAAAVGTGGVKAGAEAAWIPPPSPLLQAIAACAEGGRLAELLGTLEADLLTLEWEASSAVMEKLLADLEALQESCSQSAVVPQVLDLMRTILLSPRNEAFGLNNSALAFLGEAIQTVTTIVAQELQCHAGSDPDLRSLERQYMLLQSPADGLGGNAAAVDPRAQGPFPAIAWDQLDANLMSFARYQALSDELITKIANLDNIQRNINSMQKNLANVSADFFLRYLAAMKPSGVKKTAGEAKFGLFLFRKSAKQQPVKENENCLRWGNFYEDVEQLQLRLQQMGQNLQSQVEGINACVAELSQTILQEVILFKYGGRIFAVPLTAFAQLDKWDGAEKKHRRHDDALVKINLARLLDLKIEEERVEAEVIIIKVKGGQAALPAEEIYGREIVLFTKLETTAGSPYLEGVAALDENPCYLLNPQALVQS